MVLFHNTVPVGFCHRQAKESEQETRADVLIHYGFMIPKTGTFQHFRKQCFWISADLCGESDRWAALPNALLSLTTHNDPCGQKKKAKVDRPLTVYQYCSVLLFQFFSWVICHSSSYQRLDFLLQFTASSTWMEVMVNLLLSLWLFVAEAKLTWLSCCRSLCSAFSEHSHLPTNTSVLLWRVMMYSLCPSAMLAWDEELKTVAISPVFANSNWFLCWPYCSSRLSSVGTSPEEVGAGEVVLNTRLCRKVVPIQQ